MDALLHIKDTSLKITASLNGRNEVIVIQSFYAVLKGRKAHHTLDALDINGQISSSHSAIRNNIVDYFQNIFNGSDTYLSSFLDDLIPRLVS